MDIETYFNLNNDEDSINSSFVRAAVKTVLEECLNQLYILRHINIRNCESFDLYVVQYQTLEERFNEQEPYGDVRIPKTETNRDKVAKDITIFINIIKEMCQEIDVFGSYNVLKQSIMNIKKMTNDEKRILRSKKINENIIKKLSMKCEEERLANGKTYQETNENIQKIRFMVEDVIIYGKTERNFFKEYEATRREQNNLLCKTEEQKYIDIINEIKEKIKLEGKCHELFEGFIDEDREELVELINYWMKQYDNETGAQLFPETETRDNALLKLKGRHEYIQDQLEKATDKYNKREAELQKWNAFKLKRKEKEDRIKFEYLATLKIQAWWRGTMCRRGIPPGNMRLIIGKSIGSKRSKKSRKSKK